MAARGTLSPASAGSQGVQSSAKARGTTVSSSRTTVQSAIQNASHSDSGKARPNPKTARNLEDALDDVIGESSADDSEPDNDDDLQGQKGAKLTKQLHSEVCPTVVLFLRIDDNSSS